jgi:DNA-binding NarL/FixJ family response regulator
MVRETGYGTVIMREHGAPDKVEAGGGPRDVLCLVDREDMQLLLRVLPSFRGAELKFLDRPSELGEEIQDGSILLASARRVASENWAVAISRSRRKSGLPVIFLLGQPQMIDIAPWADLADNLLFREVQSNHMADALTLALEGYVTLPEGTDFMLPIDMVRYQRLQELSPMEKRVLSCIAEGMTNEAIAEQLGRTETHIKAIVKRILSVLGLRNRTEAAVFFYRSTGGGVRTPDEKGQGEELDPEDDEEQMAARANRRPPE